MQFRVILSNFSFITILLYFSTISEAAHLLQPFRNVQVQDIRIRHTLNQDLTLPDIRMEDASIRGAPLYSPLNIRTVRRKGCWYCPPVKPVITRSSRGVLLLPSYNPFTTVYTPNDILDLNSENEEADALWYDTLYSDSNSHKHDNKSKKKYDHDNDKKQEYNKDDYHHDHDNDDDHHNYGKERDHAHEKANDIQKKDNYEDDNHKDNYEDDDEGDTSVVQDEETLLGKSNKKKNLKKFHKSPHAKLDEKSNLMDNNNALFNFPALGSGSWDVNNAPPPPPVGFNGMGGPLQNQWQQRPFNIQPIGGF